MAGLDVLKLTWCLIASCKYVLPRSGLPGRHGLVETLLTVFGHRLSLGKCVSCLAALLTEGFQSWDLPERQALSQHVVAVVDNTQPTEEGEDVLGKEVALLTANVLAILLEQPFIKRGAHPADRIRQSMQAMQHGPGLLQQLPADPTPTPPTG